MKVFFKIIFHIISIILWTLITQIGGFIYLISVITFRKSKKGRRKRVLLFTTLYLLSTFVIVPLIAPIWGRQKIQNNQFVGAKMPFYFLANRNYVKSELNDVLQSVGKHVNNEYPGIKVKYLDANFPFIDGYRLLPHLSHNDGKKIDICFLYANQNGVSNKKPSVSGYGHYSPPLKGEHDQIQVCENKGAWQYSMAKYLQFGAVNKKLSLGNQETKFLIDSFVSQKSVGKILIEPHLKQRLKLSSNKVRYHGCQAVRHDDHIHVQLK